MTASSLGRSAMDTHLIEHIIKIAEEKASPRRRKSFYLTQSALNQQLLKLERELGIPLFRRAKTEMIPTQAGEIYLKGAREILRTKKQDLCRNQRPYGQL